MTRYYECFFDDSELNRFWGTSVTVIDGNAYELCSQPYYVAADEDKLVAIGIDAGDGITTMLELEHFLDAYCGPVDGDANVDLVNCVFPDTVSCLFDFIEIDEGEYSLATGK